MRRHSLTASVLALALLLVACSGGASGGAFDAGAVEEFPQGSVTTFADGELVARAILGESGDDVLLGGRIVFHLVRLEEGEFLALSARDSHSQCWAPWRPDFRFPGGDESRGTLGWFRDPCHGSTYDMTGFKVFGPAPRDLDRFPVEVRDGRVLITLDLEALILGDTRVEYGSTDGPEPTPQATAPAATPSPAGAPSAVAPGEEIDVPSAVVFVDVRSGEATVWAFPDAHNGIVYLSRSGDLALAPTGFNSYEVRRLDGGFGRSLSDVALHDIAPGGDGFSASGLGDAFAIYDADGEVLRRFTQADLLPTVGGSSRNSAWSPTGDAVALIGTADDDSVFRVWVLSPVADGDPLLVFEGEGTDRPRLEWSPDGSLLALVRNTGVTVIDRLGVVQWTTLVRAGNNPRWSPDGAYLLLNSVLSVDRSELGDAYPDHAFTGLSVSYLLSSDGEVLWRVLGARSCVGDPWLADSSGMRLGGHTLLTDGTLLARESSPWREQAVPGEPGVRVRWAYANALLTQRVLERVEADGSVRELLRLAPGLEGHTQRFGQQDYGFWVDDGRFVFTTTLVREFACGDTVPAYAGARVEFPPFDASQSSAPLWPAPTRAIAATVPEASAPITAPRPRPSESPDWGQVELARVIPTVEAGDVGAILDLIARVPSPCSPENGTLTTSYDSCAQAGVPDGGTFDAAVVWDPVLFRAAESRIEGILRTVIAAGLPQVEQVWWYMPIKFGDGYLVTFRVPSTDVSVVSGGMIEQPVTAIGLKVLPGEWAPIVQISFLTERWTAVDWLDTFAPGFRTRIWP